ncbi:hypothetical protein SB783_47415, partial [Paraburkholderia sp. SIMBA_009]
DIDGTLIHSDVPIKSVFGYLKAAPHRCYEPLLWLARNGTPGLKARLADSTTVDVTVLPYDPVVLLKRLKTKQDAGRAVGMR